MPGEHDIYIFETDTGGYDVYPKVAVFKNGHKVPVKFRNTAKVKAVLTFQAGLIASGPPHEVPGHGRGEFVLDSEADGVYDYTVMVDGEEADPKIIVDP